MKNVIRKSRTGIAASVAVAALLLAGCSSDADVANENIIPQPEIR